ncbi:hypothetical protein HDE_08998 [Halotydeus destructor]|nr:hypothetical protein HDE_08998 [Halotydeus destructor]
MGSLAPYTDIVMEASKKDRLDFLQGLAKLMEKDELKNIANHCRRNLTRGNHPDVTPRPEVGARKGSGYKNEDAGVKGNGKLNGGHGKKKASSQPETGDQPAKKKKFMRPKKTGRQISLTQKLAEM